MVNTILFKRQRGFTLIELMAVIAILAILAGIVAAGVTGLGSSGQAAKLEGDENTIGKAANQFRLDTFPAIYPVKTPPGLVVAGIDNVGVVDFNARNNIKPKKFVPDYLVKVPDSAGLVSWRIDTRNGNVFSADESAPLIPPSTNELDVTATSTALSASPDHKFVLKMKKNEAALEVLKIDIPLGYTIGGQSVAPNISMGSFTGKFETDNPWETGQDITTVTGTLKATSTPNEWKLEVTYPSSVTTAAASIARASRSGSTAHLVNIVPPTTAVGGSLTITLNTTGDKAHNQATEEWTLTISGTVGSASVITNPKTKGVYRWTAKEHTTIDPSAGGQDVFNAVPGGNQAVVITGVANALPTATPQSGLTTRKGTALLITLAGTDAESTSLTFVIVSGPSSGTLSTLSGSGLTRTVTYTPKPTVDPAVGTTVTDSFTFKVNDGIADSATAATVSLSITP